MQAPPHLSSRVRQLAIHTSLFVLAFLVAGGAVAQEPSHPVASPNVEAADAQAVLDYWTPERMAAAKPMPLPELEPSGDGESYQSADQPSAPVLLAHSGAPGAAPFEEWVDPVSRGGANEWGTFPFSYTRFQLYPISLYKKHLPNMQVGKLFFTIPGQGNFVCSGASINSANSAVIWTAGHCVNSPGIGFHTNVVFAPGRANGNNHNGLFTSFQLFTLNGWSNLGQFEWDLGAIVANRGGLGAPGLLGAKVGFLGYVANAPRGQHFHEIGYPAGARDLGSTAPGPQFNGEKQQVCAAAWATDDQPSGGASTGPDTKGTGCDSTGGTSGGPWIVDLSKFGGATNVIHGVNSYRYGGGPPNNLRLYSPYQGAGADNLRNAAQAVVVP